MKSDLPVLGDESGGGMTHTIYMLYSIILWSRRGYMTPTSSLQYLMVDEGLYDTNSWYKLYSII